MIRLLVVLVMVVLTIVAYYLNKNNQAISQVLADKRPPEPLQKAFKYFAMTCFILAISGVGLLILNQKLLVLIYIAIITLASTIFSLYLSKLIS